MFDFETLRYRAKMLAASAYAPRATTVPDALRKLSYDEYRLITFSGDQSWWRRDGLPYQLQFFHPGFVHQKSVQVFELNGRTVTPVKFSRDMFNYGGLKVGGGCLTPSASRVLRCWAVSICRRMSWCRLSGRATFGRSA